MFKSGFVDVIFDNLRNAVWKFSGRKVGGVEYIYSVVDRNYVQRNQWSFVVRVPRSSKGYREVRATVVPNRKVWAGLERRSLQLGRADIGKYRKRRYAKLAISDVNDERTKVILNDNIKALPKWIKAFKPIAKRKVARTKGNDGGHLVCVFDPENHRDMIRLFFALKPWILDDGYSPSESRRAAKARREWKRTISNRRSLRDLNVVVTGALSQGTRPKVLRWLSSLGAHPQYGVNGETDLLIRGPHYLGSDRRKNEEPRRKQRGIKTATPENLRIILSEASFGE